MSFALNDIAGSWDVFLYHQTLLGNRTAFVRPLLPQLDYLPKYLTDCNSKSRQSRISAHGLTFIKDGQLVQTSKPIEVGRGYFLLVPSVSDHTDLGCLGSSQVTDSEMSDYFISVRGHRLEPDAVFISSRLPVVEIRSCSVCRVQDLSLAQVLALGFHSELIQCVSESRDPDMYSSRSNSCSRWFPGEKEDIESSLCVYIDSLFGEGAFTQNIWVWYYEFDLRSNADV